MQFCILIKSRIALENSIGKCKILIAIKLSWADEGFNFDQIPTYQKFDKLYKVQYLTFRVSHAYALFPPILFPPLSLTKNRPFRQ